MGTKLRNFSTNPAVKLAAFILVVISITTAVLQIQYLNYKNVNPECLFVKEYKDSEDFLNNYVYNAFSTALEIRAGSMVQEDIPFLYYITDGEKAYSNTPNTNKSFFQQFDKAFYGYENGNWTLGSNTNSKPLAIVHYNYNFGKYTVYIAFPDEFMNGKEKVWQENRAKIIPLAVVFFSLTALSLILICLLIFGTGRKPEDKELHLTKTDKIYSDVLLALFIPFAVLWIAGVSSSPYNGSRFQPSRLDINQIYSLIWVGIITVTVTAICGIMILSFVRKIKAGMLLKHSLVYTAGYKIYDLFKSLYDGRMFERYTLTKSLFYRQLVFITSSVILMIMTVILVFIFAAPSLALIFPVLEAVIVYWYIKGNNKTFTEINKGFNDSLEEQMKSERMKIALVTNVSHDLKTPLTSIISYVDLLSKEGNLSETAGDYVKILAEKSNRLKNIVSDLFDLAKSTSGNMSVEYENIDLKKLIEQTLADMENEIERSGLKIKTNLPDKPVNIYSDGKKLYRVFQNIIDNALKYSLLGTRVYIELEEIEGRAVARIKNTAGYEMDFTVDEILQRFNRGDKSRTTEGSGLGLSIAESFTNVCGGRLKIDIDGDLFKVTVSFDLN